MFLHFKISSAKKRICFISVTLVFLFGALQAQTADELRVSFLPQESGSGASLRGLSAVDARVAWVTGTNGTVLRTSDGITWIKLSVPGADSLDFRDVEAFSSELSYVMSAGPGGQSRIYTTDDGGQSWQLQLTNPHENGFFDGIAFWDENRGVVYSDPLDSKHLIYKTTDGGKNWNRIQPGLLPELHEGEYGFAASGTGIRVSGRNQIWICSGGSQARVFDSQNGGQSWRVTPTPILSGEASTGIFGIAFRDELNGVAVGGDYRKPKETASTGAITRDGGKTWQPITGVDMSFRSCVDYVPGISPAGLIAVGSDGVSLSADDGANWSSSDSVGYHTMSFGLDKDSGWVAGSDGRIAKIVVTRK